MTDFLKNSSTTLATQMPDSAGLGGRSHDLEMRLPKSRSGDLGKSAYYGNGNDVITLGDQKNIVYAGEGINLITTGLGSDVIYAGAGGDFINAGDGHNTIFAGEGNNRIFSGNGNDLIYAGSGNDTIYSGAGDDVIYAGNGNNIINAGTGNDTVYLGSGADKLILEGGKGSVTVIGFDVKSDRLRLGESLAGQRLTFKTKGNDTLVMSGKDLLATLKDVAAGSPSLVDNGPLYRYVAKDLGSLSTNANGSVTAAAINDFGQIAGRFDTGAIFTAKDAKTGVITTNNITRQGFIWENGKQTALTPTGIKNGESAEGAKNGESVTLLSAGVRAIGNSGWIIGTSNESLNAKNPETSGDIDRGLRWKSPTDFTIYDFGDDETYFFDTNNFDQNSGRAVLSTQYFEPTYWDNGKLTRLPTLGSNGGGAQGLNNKGQLVGGIDMDGKLDESRAVMNTAVLWEKDAQGTYQLNNLGTFGADQATLRDINDVGSMIGSKTTGTGTTATSDPFLLRNEDYTALGSLGGKTGSTTGINGFDQVVGASQIATGTNHAYSWNGGVLADLNNLVTAPITYNGAAVTLNSAVSINNFGDIVATGTYTYKDAAGKDATATRSYVLNAV